MALLSQRALPCPALSCWQEGPGGEGRERRGGSGGEEGKGASVGTGCGTEIPELGALRLDADPGSDPEQRCDMGGVTGLF